MLDGKTWLSVAALIYPKGVSTMWRSGLCAGLSSSSTPNSFIHVFMDLPLCTGAQSCCSHKVGSVELSNISWYAEASRVPFTGTKGPGPAPEKQPHTIIPPPPNFTLGTMQSDKYCSPVNCQTQTRPSDCQMKIQRFALHLLMYVLDAAAQPWKPIP